MTLQIPLIEGGVYARIDPVVKEQTVYLVALWHGSGRYWKITGNLWDSGENAERAARLYSSCWAAARIIKVELK